MTLEPEEFRESVLPKLLNAWSENCFCAHPGFQKLIGFNFRDYDVGPVALADAEILIDEIIRQRFRKQGEAETRPGEISQAYRCPQCNATCKELFAEFSINMYQSTVSFDEPLPQDSNGQFLIGFYGFSQQDFAKVHDYERAASAEEFIEALTNA